MSMEKLNVLLKKGRTLLAALSVSVLAVPHLAQAAQPPYVCTGNLTSVATTPAGHVVISTDAGFNSVYVCKLGATYNNASPEACKGVLAILLAAKMSSRSVNFYFQNDDLSCANRPAWNDLTGWYYGPAMN
jgi:hypothetical protein